MFSIVVDHKDRRLAVAAGSQLMVFNLEANKFEELDETGADMTIHVEDEESDDELSLEELEKISYKRGIAYSQQKALLARKKQKTTNDQESTVPDPALSSKETKLRERIAKRTALAEQAMARSLCYRCVKFNESGTLLATASDDKIIRLWKLDTEGSTWKCIARRLMPKRPSRLLFTPDEREILLADKTGEVYAVPLTLDSSNVCMGHLSTLTSMVLIPKSSAPPSSSHPLLSSGSPIFTPSTHLLVTADADARIRVSGFPCVFDAKLFMFGAQTFVSEMAPLNSLQNAQSPILLTGGDGNFLLAWDLTEGKEIQKIVLPMGKENSSASTSASTQKSSPQAFDFSFENYRVPSFITCMTTTSLPSSFSSSAHSLVGVAVAHDNNISLPLGFDVKLESNQMLLASYEETKRKLSGQPEQAETSISSASAPSPSETKKGGRVFLASRLNPSSPVEVFAHVDVPETPIALTFVPSSSSDSMQLLVTTQSGSILPFTVNFTAVESSSSLPFTATVSSSSASYGLLQTRLQQLFASHQQLLASIEPKVKQQFIANRKSRREKKQNSNSNPEAMQDEKKEEKESKEDEEQEEEVEGDGSNESSSKDAAGSLMEDPTCFYLLSAYLAIRQQERRRDRDRSALHKLVHQQKLEIRDREREQIKQQRQAKRKEYYEKQQQQQNDQQEQPAKAE